MQDDFLQIGAGATIGEAYWVGPVIATRDAIYFVLKSLGDAGGTAGLPGVSPRADERQADANQQDMTSPVFGSLPESWRERLGRNPNGCVDPQTPMVVIRKEDVVRIKKKKWYQRFFRIELKSGDSVQVTASGLAVNAKLRLYGWWVS